MPSRLRDENSREGAVMEKLEIALYGAAIYLAIKSLVSLMSDHSRATKQRFAVELAAAQQAAAAKAAEQAVAAAAAEKPEQRPLKKAG
jgi:hypothetical protein